MGLTNFTADDFKKGDGMKVSRSKRDRLSGPQPTTQPRVAPNADPEAVPSGTVPEIMTWVGKDPVRAQKALDVELSDERPRKGLVSSLTEMVGDSTNDGTNLFLQPPNTRFSGIFFDNFLNHFGAECNILGLDTMHVSLLRK